MVTQSHVSTSTPERYVTRLCKHFGHKVDASCEDGHGRVDFDGGTCTLDAEAGTLVLRVEADDAETATRLADVVGRHLLQFAEGREDLDVAWSPVAPA